jgi:hypothetical protein
MKGEGEGEGEGNGKRYGILTHTLTIKMIHHYFNGQRTFSLLC